MESTPLPFRMSKNAVSAVSILSWGIGMDASMAFIEVVRAIVVDVGIFPIVVLTLWIFQRVGFTPPRNCT